MPKGELDNVEDADQDRPVSDAAGVPDQRGAPREGDEVDTSLLATESEIMMSVVDDGCGFAPDARSKRGSFGLFGLGERASQLGGRATVVSAPQAGTRIYRASCR